MSDTDNFSDCDRLEHLLQTIDHGLACKVPNLIKRAQQLQQRCRNRQPIDRALGKLAQDVEQSVQCAEQRRLRAPDPEYPLALPVVERREEILAAIRDHQVIVLCGETGSGKTTQLPKLCLELGLGVRGKIGHTQPRRIAARSLAERIAEELHSTLGEHVGYKVRYQDRIQDSSYIKVMTDGILLAEIQSDPDLRQYDALIIDEAHERSLNIDFLLGILCKLLPGRPDLKLIITSATIDPDRFSKHFGNAPVVEVSGRTYPVETRYRPLPGDNDDLKDRNRGQAIVDAVDELARDGPGDILVFLPGERAIRDASELLRKHHPADTEILPLYARLSVAQQTQIFRPHKRRRIVLSTNVAETSLTVPGIRYVVDTGLARVSRYNYRTKVQRLPIEAVSQASANQRAGRCGRVAAGICIRLYAEDDFQMRTEFTEPEIQRTNLASVILKMAALKLGAIEEFPFVDRPDSRLIRDGYKLLHELGAVDKQGQLTSTGRALTTLPIDPRLARMVLAAQDLQCLREVLVIVSALEVADPRERPMEHAQAADQKHAIFSDAKSDFISYLNIWTHYQQQKKHLSQNKLRKWCKEHFLSYMRLREWSELHGQLQATLKNSSAGFNDSAADYRSIHSALLTGLLGNLANQIEAREYTGARNLKFVLFPGSGVKKSKPKWLVAAELVETGQRYLRTVAAIDPAWVEPLAKHLVKHSYVEPHWEKGRGQVVALENVTLYGLRLVTGRKVNYGPIDPETSRSLFIRYALVAGELAGRQDFAEHNRRLLLEMEELESKSRRRDVLVDEQDLYDFFDERIPADVYDAARFQRWWKKEKNKRNDLLRLDREQIMRHGADQVNENQFPDALEIRGLCIAACYRFSPGEQHDGLSVQIPAVALKQLQPADFEWLVPGLIKEKVSLLIKSLPKHIRRNFVPVPDYAEACLQAMPVGQGSLIKTLTEQLQRMTGVSVAFDQWRPELLPAHLFAWFEVVNANGKCIGSGRDLLQLQQQFSDTVEHGFIAPRDTRFERDNVQEWDFGDLPDYVELDNAGLTLRAYPALSVTAGKINLKLFDQRDDAVVSHRLGLLALFRTKAHRSVKEIRRCIPELQKQVMWSSTFARGEVLQTDIEQAVIQAAFLGGQADVRTADIFNQQLEAGQQQLVELATQIGRASFNALQSYHELNRVLKKAVTPALIAATVEVRLQMQELVYPGFVAATPLAWLPHIGRYLQAARKRLEKLPGDPARDRKHALMVQKFRDQYRDLAKRIPANAALEDLRWHIEELCVSLHAQDLGTSVKVSPERVTRLWEQLPGHL